MLDPGRVSLVLAACVDGGVRCLTAVRALVNVAGTRWRIPFTLGKITVDHPGPSGGRPWRTR